jgi:SpoVK/Ycf46/Vps4 family AAA+-type ATPase
MLHFEPPAQVPAPILPNSLRKDEAELISEWQFEDRLRAGGVAPRHTVLLHGPPGCGKTHLAKHIASALEMPLYIVRFDSLVSSYLGETGSNLRQVFDFIAANRCALLIDEIDAIAKLRDDRNELGELKRVVISLLQNIDLTATRSILLAATNHPHLLDHAIWRRFEVVWELGELSADARLKLLQEHVGGGLEQSLHSVLPECTEGLSGADLVRVAQMAKRREILGSTANRGEAILLSLLEHVGRRETQSNGDQRDDRAVVMALALRRIDAKSYSFQALERLTGIPHSTLHHRQKQDKNGRRATAHHS